MMMVIIIIDIVIIITIIITTTTVIVIIIIFACEQALHLWDIMKSRCVRGDLKAAVGGEKGELATISLIHFHFHPGHPKALKLSPQTCGRLESHIKTAEESF